MACQIRPYFLVYHDGPEWSLRGITELLDRIFVLVEATTTADLYGL